METTHPYNVNLSMAFFKVAFSHPYYLTFTLHTYHHPEQWFRSYIMQMASPSQLHTCTSTGAAMKYIQPYLHIVFAWTKHNNLPLNPDKTTCTLFTPDHGEYKSNRDLKINNTSLAMETHPKVVGLTLDPKLSYSTHIHNMSVHPHTHPPTHTHTHTQTSTNNKNTRCNSMWKTEGDRHGYLQGSHANDSSVCTFHMAAFCILDQH